MNETSGFRPATHELMSILSRHTRVALPALPSDSRAAVCRLSQLAELAIRLVANWVDPRFSGDAPGSSSTLLPRFRREFQVLRETAFRDHLLFQFWLNEVSVPESSALLESAIRRWGISGHKPRTAKAVCFMWAAETLPAIQTIIEAAPVELEGSLQQRLQETLRQVVASYGIAIPEENAGSPVLASAVSLLFHDLVKDLYRELGAEYYPVRLFEDSLRSEFLKSFLADARTAYRSDASRFLQQHRLVARHGTVVRIVRPVVRLRDENAPRGYRWEGALEYAEIEDTDAPVATRSSVTC
jgi:hypothetical protein